MMTCFVKFYFLVLFTTILNCYALNCRSEGGPKENELKNTYMNCLKRQERQNFSESRGNSNKQDWREPRGNQRSWNNDGDRMDRFDKMGGRDDGVGVKNRSSGNSRYDEMGNRDNIKSGNEEFKIGGRNMMGSKISMGNRNDPRGDKSRGKSSANDRMDYNNHGGNDRLNGRDDFNAQSEEFGSDMPRYNYGSKNQAGRYKREKRVEMNSGHRSQYNPNSQKTAWQDDNYHQDERNSNENQTSKQHNMDSKACALHCFLEELDMMGDNGMPDRYLVTHVMTKDVKNEDLKDFLEESIEDCFQMLSNENSEDKCKFSKDLMLCLSEKGRANCDDWKDDIQL